MNAEEHVILVEPAKKHGCSKQKIIDGNIEVKQELKRLKKSKLISDIFIMIICLMMLVITILLIDVFHNIDVKINSIVKERNETVEYTNSNNNYDPPATYEKGCDHDYYLLEPENDVIYCKKCGTYDVITKGYKNANEIRDDF